MIKLLEAALIIDSSVEADLSIREALEGDPTRLIKRVSEDRKLRKDEKAFLNDTLTGKFVLSANRPPKVATQVKRWKAAVTALIAHRMQGGKKGAAVALSAQIFDVTERYVYQALKELNEDPRRKQSAERIAEAVCALAGGEKPIPSQVTVRLASSRLLYPPDARND